MSQSDALYRAELYVRSLAADDSQVQIEEALSRLEELESAGTIDDYAVHVWEKGISLDPQIVATDAGAFIRDRVAAFREWSRETGRALPGFAERTTRSAMTGRTHQNLTVPTIALCERHGEEIVWVAPCENADGTVTTVADRLAALTTVDDDLPVGARSVIE